MSDEKKTVKVDFENACGKMKLKLTSRNAINQSLKIMEIFDKKCNELESKGEKEDV